MVYNERVTLLREPAENQSSDHKVYVDVTAEFSADGELRPLSLRWQDGRRYVIDRVIDIRRAASMKAGGMGIRYICEIGGRRAQLFYEENYRWFMEPKTAD